MLKRLRFFFIPHHGILENHSSVILRFSMPYTRSRKRTAEEPDARQTKVSKANVKTELKPETALSQDEETHVQAVPGKKELIASTEEPLKTENADARITVKSEKLEKLIDEPKSAIESKLNIFVGAHVSAAGGSHNAVTNAAKMGCRAFALFLKNQRRWDAKPLEEKVIEQFKELVKVHNYPSHLIVPHSSYLLNCGSPDPELLAKSKNALLDEMKRCELLGITLYNLHPGSTCGKQPVEKSIASIADCINSALQQTKGVTAVLENMCCQGHTIGGKFEELKAIIDLIEDKTRVGVCLDTCHAFAAGFDLSTKKGYEATLKSFDTIIGLSYLKAIHLNDSKGDLGSHLDRHEITGRGKLGMEAFRRIMNDKRLQNIPIILETPNEDGWEEEIKVLYSLQSKK